MEKSTSIGKILVISLALTGLWACSSDKDDSLEIVSSSFYVIQDGEGGAAKFIPYFGAVTKNQLSSVAVTNINTGIQVEGDIYALQNFETRVDEDNSDVLGNTTGDYRVRVTATNGDVVTLNYNFNRDVNGELLGYMAIESFEFAVTSFGEGESYKEGDEFKAILTAPVDGATEYGMIIIPDGQGAYYRTESYRHPMELESVSNGKYMLYESTDANKIINRGSGASSWRVAIYATDGKGLYKEGNWRTLRKGVNSFD